MKARWYHWLLNLLTFATLKRRIIFALTAGVLMSSILMSVVSYRAIYTMQQNKIKTLMSFDLEQQAESLTQTYTNLLQITQQLSPEGNVGDLVEDYLTSNEPYTRSSLSKNISR